MNSPQQYVCMKNRILINLDAMTQGESLLKLGRGEVFSRGVAWRGGSRKQRTLGIEEDDLCFQTGGTLFCKRFKLCWVWLRREPGIRLIGDQGGCGEQMLFPVSAVRSADDRWQEQA